MRHPAANHPGSLPLLSPDLLARFRQGDDRAFVEVYDHHAADLRPVVARFFASPFEREEATQEIWMQVHRNVRAFDPARGALLPWLRALAANRCKEILRAQGRRPALGHELDEEAMAPELVLTETPERGIRRERLRSAVAAFVSGLGSEEAGVFRLALMDERGHEEVAAQLGISPRRCKYLKLKLLERAARTPALKAALEELLDE